MKKIKNFLTSNITIAFCIIVMLGLFPVNALAWKFIAYGDTRTYPNDHEAALQQMLDYAPDFDFIVNVGDVVSRGHNPDHWDTWAGSMNTIFGSTLQSGNPFYISCPGNHEWYRGCDAQELANWHNYLSYQANRWPENDTRYWYFDHQNARIIILDFMDDLDAQKAMIEEACSTNTQTWIFAVFHGPVLTFGNKPYDADIHRKFAKPLYEGGCDMFFVGHAHSYIRSKKVAFDGTNHPLEDETNGTVQIMTGDGGAGRDPIRDINASGFEYLSTPNYTTQSNQTPGMTIIEINGNALNLKHYNQDGLLDEANFTPNEKVNCTDCVPTYSLVTNTSGMGSVNPSGGTYDENTVVSVTALPATGWQFDSWSGDISGTSNPVNITMNANKNITANFSLPGGGTIATLSVTDDAYVLDNITSENTGNSTTISIKNTTRKVGLVKFDLNGISETIISATLKLTGANSASGGNVSVYEINNDNWNESSVTYSNAPAKGSYIGSTILGGSGAVNNFDVSSFVTAEQSGDNIVSLWLNDDQNNSSRYDFHSKEASGDQGPKLELILSGDPPPTYSLTTSAVNGSVSPLEGEFDEGTVVSLTATPDVGYEFSHWSGDASGTTNTVNITMDSDKSVVANFAPEAVTYTLTTIIDGPGAIDLNPAGGTYAPGTAVTLTAIPTPGGESFNSWSGDISGTENPTTIIMDGNKTVTAHFEIGHILSVSATEGGTVTPESGIYSDGETATLTATALPEYEFSHWSGDLTGTTNPIDITMNDDKSITANFIYNGSSTSVTLSPTDDSFILDNSVNTNKGADPTFSIKNVTKKVGLVKFDLSSISGQISSAAIELTGANAATGGNVSIYSIANDNWDEETVTYSNAPAKGSLLGSSSLGAAGTVYSIDITNFVVAEQSGDDLVSLWINDNQSNGSRYDFSTKEAAGDVGPKLVLEVNGGTGSETYTLTTSVVGNGSVSPSGGTYDEGTVVTLTATPVTGWILDSWSGDASGSDNPITITMNSNKNISAVFDIIACCNYIVSNLTPTDDAFVKSTVANSNFGANTTLKVNAANKQAFIKFDVSSIGTVSNAEIQITPSSTSGIVEVWEVSNDAWNEGSVTWNTKPSATTYIGTIDIAAGITSVTVTNYIEEQALADDAASFALIATQNVNTIFSSKEGSNGPVLVVEHDDIPKTAIDAESTNIQMFPNPTTGIVNIAINDIDFNNGIVNIYNSQGVLIETVSIENAYSTVKIKQNSGLYLMEVIYNDKVQVTPVMKQ